MKPPQQGSHYWTLGDYCLIMTIWNPSHPLKVQPNKVEIFITIILNKICVRLPCRHRHRCRRRRRFGTSTRSIFHVLCCAAVGRIMLLFENSLKERRPPSVLFYFQTSKHCRHLHGEEGGTCVRAQLSSHSLFPANKSAHRGWRFMKMLALTAMDLKKETFIRFESVFILSLIEQWAELLGKRDGFN